MSEKNFEYCRTCYHWASNCCIYILNTGHCRPCEAGKGCTEKISKREYFEMMDNPNLDGFEPVKATRRPRTNWTTEMISELKKLLADGLSYTAIADRMGLELSAVQSKAMNLKLAKPESEDKSPIKKPAAKPAAKPAEPKPEPEPETESVTIPKMEKGWATKMQETPSVLIKRRHFEDAATQLLYDLLVSASPDMQVKVFNDPVKSISVKVKFSDGKRTERTIEIR